MPLSRNDCADVAIVGGGFTGAALACALADSKRKIVLFEARRTPPSRFAGELLHPAKLGVLGDGLLGRLRARGADVRGFAVSPGADRPATLLPYLGARPGLGIEHGVLVDELRRAAAERPGVELRLGARAEVLFDHDARAIGVEAGGLPLYAPLVLAAEGRHSSLRTQLDFPTEARLISFTAALRVRGPLPNPGFGHVLLGAPGPILAYPIARDEVRMCFDLPGLKVDAPSLPERLRTFYAPAVPAPLRAAMLAALDGDSLQLAANHAVSTRQCVAPGLALVGDAGGCAHPLTAAGMSVCLNDVELLAEELAHHSADEALARFEQRRYRFVRTREALTDALYDLFGHLGPARRALHGALFGYWRGVRGRTASVALLQCARSGRAHLAAEWLRVFAGATVEAARGSSGPRGAALADLFSFAARRAGRILRE